MSKTYNIFISHNLVGIFTTFIISKYKLKMKFLKDIRYFIVAIIIILITYVINYDFRTKYNVPNWDIFIGYQYWIRYTVLIIMGFIGYIVSFIISCIYVRGESNEKN